MDRQEAAESNQEFGEPLSIEEWQSTNQAKETLSEVYFEASQALQKELKDAPVNATCKPFTEIERRATLERQAYNQIDCAMDDAYQEYVAMHPFNQGYITETYSRIYPDGGL